MPVIVDRDHAEQGKSVRLNFVTLSAGLPYTPGVLLVRVHPGQDVTDGTEIAVLTVVPTGLTGRYYADWAVGLAEAPGFYTMYVRADGGAFEDSLHFEAHLAGAFTVSQQSLAVNTQTQLSQISAARDINAFVALVRMLLRDHDHLNRLTTGRETGDGEIRACTFMAISQYNSTPPLLQPVGFADFPGLGNLVVGTIGWVLGSSAILRARNYLNYTDAGVTVETENPQIFQNMSNAYAQQFQQWAASQKVAKNVNATFGGSPTGVHSEYLLLSSMFGDATFGSSGVMLQ